MENEWSRRTTEPVFLGYDMSREMSAVVSALTNVIGGPKMYQHDVFISFRGEDTRRSFVSHLHATLANAGIKVFIDDKVLQRGQEISASLRQAIEGSRISIVVFSANYAGSRWCLQELEEIMVRRKGYGGNEVLPIFFSVDPFEVKYQRGTFGKTFENLVNRRWVSDDDARAWREALTEAANLSGFHFSNYRNEVDMIDHIVEDIIMKLDINLLFVAEHPVGVESRVNDMMTLLEGRSNDVFILGLWGMGGIGKTTIAKSLYNEIGREFKHRSFLANVRETWEEGNGKVNLQEQLLSNIMKTRGMKLQGVDFGKIKLKENLCHKKSLVVLDDVNKVDQLSALCGRGEWLGPGSILIITTRDERLLNFPGVKNVHVHGMKSLNEIESLELFSWHAFKQKYPKGKFNELSSNVVAYCCGLPLAIEVLGSYLFDREIPYWECVLAKLKRIPNSQIKEQLKISYDGLNDEIEREIFLHISCFFIGMDRNYVTQVLDDCGLYALNGINTLKERSLITIDKRNKLGMHNLLRDMGREIIHQQSPDEPGKRSRLWCHEEVLDVLTTKSGTKAIKGLALSMPKTNRVLLSTKAFKKMKRLKFLQLDHVHLDGDFEYLSRDLRWLRWHGFHLSYMPSSFYQGNLVAMDLKYSNLKMIWENPMLLEKLKILNLSHSPYLRHIPDFSKLPNRQKLILKDCPSLSMVHDSIGDLKNLLFVNLKDCTSLGNLPRSFYRLNCLKTLILSGCSKIDKLEEDFEQMESLTILMADNTAIKQVPFSIVRSKRIAYISLCGHEGLSADVFPSLIWSWMSPLNYPQSLDTFHGLSSNLRSLWVQCPLNLLTQVVARILDTFLVTDRLEMEATPNTSQIAHISTSGNSLSYLLIQMGACNKFSNPVREYILQEPPFLLGDNYPHWLTYTSEGSFILFKVPQVSAGFTLKGMIFYILYSSSCMDSTVASECLQIMLIINLTKGITQLHKRDAITTAYEDEEWQAMISNLEPGDQVKVMLVFGDGFIVKNTTMFLLYSELKEEGVGMTLEDQNALLSIDGNVQCFKSKRRTTNHDEEGECSARIRKAKKM